jgi:hypothetical protein
MSGRGDEEDVVAQGDKKDLEDFVQAAVFSGQRREMKIALISTTRGSTTSELRECSFF